jgi:primary-amine oxidase
MKLKVGILYFFFGISLFAASHPFDPLDKKEIEIASKCARSSSQFPKDGMFPLIALNEPPKSEVKSWTPGKSFRREALIWVFEKSTNKTFQGVCDLKKSNLISWREEKNAQPMVLLEEYEKLPVIVKKDLRWQEAMKKRGITDFSKVQVDTWAAGHLINKDFDDGRRLLRGISYLKENDMNFYGRPIEGVIVLVDMNEEKVVEVVDTGAVEIAEKSEQFDKKSQSPTRKDLKPLKITQPDGVSYKKKGNEIVWQKWHFRWTLHPREGLILYDIGYEDQGKIRPVLYRASVSEMVVPYGDPDSNWSWRNAFDAGEYGIGRLAAPLEKGKDIPANGELFDATFSNDLGKPYVQKNVVGLYERDGGMIWKHWDIYSDKNEARRARELVITFTTAVGNYDYAFKWIFGQEGGIRQELDLSGIMLPKGVSAKNLEDPKLHEGGHYGHLVAPNVVAPHHQHFFNFRLDFDIDGEKNSVMEINTRSADKGSDNPMNNVIQMEETVFKKESDSCRNMSLEEARKWRVFNPNVKNKLGYNPGYIVLPEDNTIPYARPESAVRKRAGFIENHFWTTQYHPDEIYSAGDFINQNKLGHGLKQWASNDESIDNQDLVTWYTVGITHVPRPEEWPIMPVAHLGFKLLPGGFFTKNPSLDLP